MRLALRRFAPGILLIALASSILLLADLDRRGNRRIGGPSVAILQHASMAVLDEAVVGMIDGLADSGIRDGVSGSIRIINAEGDAGVATSIAREMVASGADLILTTSTTSLQAVANANGDGRAIHVFSLVSDPHHAGIGLDESAPENHPRHIVGQSALLVPAEGFRLLKQTFPGLKRVGTAWNPGETNARKYMVVAREVCEELGITLLEATAETRGNLAEAMDSVIARGAQALWVGGDTIVLSSVDMVLAAARRGNVPVFTVMPGKADRGTFLDLGLDYHEVGRQAGLLAGRILNGQDPSTIPIHDVTDAAPPRLTINTLALKGLSEPWSVPPDLLRRATTVVDESGVHVRAGTLPVNQAGGQRRH